MNAVPNTYAECQAQGRVPGDCGEGIHLMGSSYSTVTGNVVTDNVITVNNLDGDNDFAPHADDQTTGVLVASAGKLSIDVSGNEIVGNHFGIWTTGPATVKNANSNLFEGDTVNVAQG